MEIIFPQPEFDWFNAIDIVEPKTKEGDAYCKGLLTTLAMNALVAQDLHILEEDRITDQLQEMALFFETHPKVIVEVTISPERYAWIRLSTIGFDGYVGTHFPLPDPEVKVDADF